MLAREDRCGSSERHDQVRLGTIGERRLDVVDDRLFRRADKPRRADDHLNDVHGTAGEAIEFDTEAASEGVESQIAAIERLQQQDMPDDRRRLTSGRAERQHAGQHRMSPSLTDMEHLPADPKDFECRGYALRFWNDIHLRCEPGTCGSSRSWA